MRLLSALAAAAAGIALGPAADSALAATLSVSPDGAAVTFVGEAGEANDLRITGGLGAYNFHDAGIPFITIDGPGCTPAAGGSVTCTAAPDAQLSVWLADGDDRADASGVTSLIQWQDGGGDDEIQGGDGIDFFHADFGSDSFAGGPGGDSFFPYPSATSSDVLRGGTGVDTIRYDVGDAFDAGVSVSEDGVADDGLAGASDDVGADIEIIRGTGGPDTLRAAAGAQTLEGGAGDDTLNGGPGNDTLEGGAGDDTLIGGSGPDQMRGGQGLSDSGYDIVSYEDHGASDGVTASLASGGGGAAVDGSGDHFSQVEALRGGTGADTLTGDDGDNEIDGGGGGDSSLSGGGGDDVVAGGAGNDSVNGGAGDDTLLGEAGNDTLTGGAGIDDLQGGPGADLVFDYLSAPAGVTVTLDDIADDGPDGDNVHADVETVYGSPHDDTLTGSDASNQLYGGAGDDRIGGGGGNDSLDGGAGGDDLDGGAGDDRLRGGDGADALDGGPGADDLGGQGGDDALAAADGSVDGAIDCGDGAGDSASVDLDDPATVACETEDRAVGHPPGGGTPPPPGGDAGLPPGGGATSPPGGTTAPPGGTAQPQAGDQTPPAGGRRRHRAPALLQVRRARIVHRHLRIVATIKRRADGGRVRIVFRGRSYSRKVRRGRVRLTTRAGGARHGRVKLAYRGSGAVRPASATLRAARRVPHLKLRRPRLRGRRLTARGTIARRARGRVKITATWEDGAFVTHRWKGSAKIGRGGRWRLRDRLPRGPRSGVAVRATYAGRGAWSGAQRARTPAAR